MENTFWKETWIGNYTFYFGLFSKGDWRLGVSIGNECSSVDLFRITFGFMK
jgi:hypothetical protein